MRNALALAACAAIAFLGPSAASAQTGSFCFGNAFFCRDTDPFSDRYSTTFDLGVDVRNVPLTRPGVNQFLATLSPTGQQIMVKTCQNYLGNPSQVQSPRTIQFCQVLLTR